MASTQCLAPNDWLAHPELLPPRPQTATEAKYTRLFAVDLHGRSNHDQYIFFAPNGLAIVGIAPSHPLVAAHRRTTGYKPLELQYVPPQLDSLSAEELAAAAADDDAQEDAIAGAGPPKDEAGASADPMTDGDAPLEPGAGAGTSPSPERQGDGQSSPGGAAGAKAGEPSPASRHPDCEPFPPGECSSINFEAGGAAAPAPAPGQSRKRGRGAGGGGGGSSKPRHLRPGALLARVEKKGGGGGFPMWAVCGGQLMELNDRLKTNPALLYDRPCREGYLAIFSPGRGAAASLLASGRVLSEPEYLRLRGLAPNDLL